MENHAVVVDLTAIAQNYLAAGLGKLEAEVTAESLCNRGHISREQYQQLIRTIDQVYATSRSGERAAFTPEVEA